jgi:hypothetical protein
MWTWMTGGQKFLLLVLFLTTFFGGFAYLCYLAISYRMERASPVLGPKILEREAAATSAAAARELSPTSAVLMGVGGLLVGGIGLFAVALISASSDHKNKSASTSLVKQATRVAPAVVSDGCDLAGVIPNCKEVMAALRAKTEQK